MKQFLLFSFLFFEFSVFAQIEKCNIISDFKKAKVSLIKDTAKISRVIKDVYSKQFGKPFYMANPKGLFNSTDMITEGLPNERLIYSGYDKSKKLFYLYFEAGGSNGVSNILLIIKKSINANIVLQNSMFASDLKRNINGLKQLINCKDSKLSIYK